MADVGGILEISKKLGLDKSTADAGLIDVKGSIAFAAGDNLITEKQTSAIVLAVNPTQHSGLFLLAIDKPTENIAGDLTIYVYNQVKVDGTNVRNCLHSTLVVEKVTDAATFRCFLLQGLFLGEGKIIIGMKFATESGAITVYYALYTL